MGKLAQETIAQLNAAKNEEEYGDSLWIAGDLISKVSTINFKSGVDWVDSEEVTEQEVEDIKAALAGCLERTTDVGIRGSIFWALGKSRDPKYLKLYQTSLAEHLTYLNRHGNALFQLLIALDYLQEEVFQRDPDGTSSQSTIEIEKNIRQARQYLANLGILIPW